MKRQTTAGVNACLAMYVGGTQTKPAQMHAPDGMDTDAQYSAAGHVHAAQKHCTACRVDAHEHERNFFKDFSINQLSSDGGATRSDAQHAPCFSIAIPSDSAQMGATILSLNTSVHTIPESPTFN